MHARVPLRTCKRQRHEPTDGCAPLACPLTQGTKHEFFAIFSKESRGASPERTAGPSSGRTPSTAAAAAAASSAGGGGGGGRRPSASFAPPPRTSIMPVVMQPAVPHAHGGPTRDTPPRHEGRMGGGAAMAAAAAAAAAGSLPAVGSRLSGDGGRGGGSDVAGPSGGARGWARPGGAEGKGQPAGPQQQQQQQRTPWNSGPFREPGALGTGRCVGGGAVPSGSMLRREALGLRPGVALSRFQRVADGKNERVVDDEHAMRHGQDRRGEAMGCQGRTLQHPGQVMIVCCLPALPPAASCCQGQGRGGGGDRGTPA